MKNHPRECTNEVQLYRWHIQSTIPKNEPLAEVCLVNLENLIDRHYLTQLQNGNDNQLAKGQTTARISLHGMFPNDKITSKAVVDDPITGEGMTKDQREDDTNAHTPPDPRQMKHRTENGCKNNFGKAHERDAKSKPKRNVA